MSYTFTLSGSSSVLSAQFCPPIDLDENAEYSISLINFEAYNSIPNIDSSNNRFHYNNDKVLEIPEGSYEISDINKYIKNYFTASHFKLGSVVAAPNSASDTLSRTPFILIESNNNTLKSEIKANIAIDFRPENSIGRLLGFKPRELKPSIRHISDFPAKIQKVNAICIECNLVTGSFINDRSVHIIHEFFPSVPPGYKIIECPANVIYLPVNKRQIDNISIKIADQDGDLINFRGEVITVRLHLKRNGS